jgi:allantoin racemase
MEGTLEKVLEAEKKGYDGVFISCNLDIALYEAREIVDIPVTATLESAALVSYIMGAKYSLISVDEQNAKIQKMLLDVYGLGSKFASYRSIGIDASRLYPETTSDDMVLEKTIEASKKAIEEDGAEIIIPGCTLIGSVITKKLENPEKVLGVPVIDGMVAGFKLCEMMVDLKGQAGVGPVSRMGFFKKPPIKDFNTLRDFLTEKHKKKNK